MTYRETVKIKEVPVWSIFVFCSTLIFGAGQLYANQLENTKAIEDIRSQHSEQIEKIQENHEKEMDALKKSMKEMQALEHDALRKLGILTAEMVNIKKTMDKLDARTELRYESR